MLTVQRVIHLLPASDADRQRLAEALAVVAPDHSLRITGGVHGDLFVIGGASDAALEDVVDRLSRTHGVSAALGRPHGVHDVMLARAARGVGRHLRLEGQQREYAHVELALTPGGHWEPAEIDGQAWHLGIPRRFVPSIQSTLRQLLLSTLGICGLDEVGVAITLASYHDRDSTPDAFAAATTLAFRDAMAKGGTVMVTSILRLLVAVPVALERTVVAALFDRHAEPEIRTTVGDRVQLVARAPLVSLLGFDAWLRDVSGGAGAVQMRFAGLRREPGEGLDGDDDRPFDLAAGVRVRPPRPHLRSGVALIEPDDDLEAAGAVRVMRVGAPS